MPAQLNLFSDPDPATKLASSYLDLAWQIVQLRTVLREQDTARLWDERALTQTVVDGIRDHRERLARIPLRRAACRRRA